MVRPGRVVGPVLVLTLTASLSGGQQVGVVRFQTGDVASTESFLDTGLGGLPRLRQVTMFMHLRLRRITSHIPLLNYAINGSNEELFVELVPKKKDMHVQCCGGMVSKAFKFNLKMFTWQHICVSLNLDTRILNVIYDELEYQVHLENPSPEFTSRTEMEVLPGGRFVVGQKLYSMEGDFIVLETLDGEIADYRIYDMALNPQQMHTLAECQDIPNLREPLIDLHSNHFEVRGPTTTRKVSMDELCGKRVTGFYLFFPQKMIFERAYSWCTKLKGSLILPEDSDTNAYFFDRFVSYKDQCDDIWTHLYWIGAGGNLTSRKWLKLTDGMPITWYRFLREYRTVTPEFQCIAAVTHDRYKWAACPCDIETCILCNFTTHPQMHLRGLCKDSSMDRLFSFRDNENYELVFDGLSHITMFKANGTWVMRSRLYPYLSGYMIAQWDGQFPVGVHRWHIEGDRCREKEVDLLLTSCHSDEYTCDDGTCISKNRRCDLSVDCEDQSDEMNCKVVLFPDGYSVQLPPPTINSKPVPIHFFLNITSIREFDLVSFKISLDVSLRLKWKDRRLKYSSLQDNYKANKLKDMHEVWTPDMEMKDCTKSALEKLSHSRFVYVVKAAGPLKDDDTTIREDKVYSGSENWLIYQQEERLTFKCHFQLQMYPFDRQNCCIIFTISDVTTDFGFLIQDSDGVAFVGNRQLLEYSLLAEEITNYTENNISHIKIELDFRNQYSYYIGNTFMPSFMLVVICCATLHFDLPDFQDRIMVSLTSLLVLATFFTQTSQTIPKTSYLKIIDIWFVALIFEDFSIIMALVYIETLRLAQPRQKSFKVLPATAITSFKDNPSRPSSTPCKTRAERVNQIILIFCILANLVLLLVFVPVCVRAIVSM